MPAAFAGGCACGAIRFHVNLKPLAMYNCHCRSCQKTSGAPSLPLLVVTANDTRVSGDVRFSATHINETNHAEHVFCNRCGSALFARNPEKPELLLITAGVVDQCDWYKPVADIWTASAKPWVHMDRQIPKVFKSPPLLEKDSAVTL